METNSLKLYAITDRKWLSENSTLAKSVEEAIIGGVTMIQLREKQLPYDELKKLAISVQEVCKKYKVPFLINDNVELAKEIDADGVHVGQSDAAVCEARKILGPDKIIGATAKTVEQALVAEQEGADYLGSGAIFGTTTKADAKTMTFELLDEICDSVNIPVVAIGGIDETNIEGLRGHRIAGAAVISGIFSKPNVRQAAGQLWDILYGKKIIHSITNTVTINEVANLILAVGGSPIMAHHPFEVEEIQCNASALLINLGATDDYEAIETAYRCALKYNHPIVIDPVGVGGSSYRRDYLQRLLCIGSPTCIRGNFGEIKAILENTNTMRGLDSDVASDETVVMELARKLGCIVIATGATDIISDGKEIVSVKTGSEMQKKVTGSGCMLSAAICTILAMNPNKTDIAVVEYACQFMGDKAAEAAVEINGSMSFLNRWIDYISM